MSEGRKKILFIITKSNFGGAQRYVYDIATNLPPSAYEVVVACGGNGVLVEKLREAGIRVHSVEHFERDIHISKEWKALGEVRALIRRERPDIVHINSSKAGILGTVAACIEQTPCIIFTAHGWPFFEKRNIGWRIFVWAFSWITTLLAHHVIVVSAYDKTRARLWGLSQKLTTVHTAISDFPLIAREDARAALFPPAIQHEHTRDIWVVSTGEHTKNKNLLFLLDAVRTYNEVAPRKLFLTLMSDGEDRPALEAYAETHTMTSQIHFTGFVPEARSYLRAFDIFVLPSLKEGLPYGLLEAGHAGLFAIASDVGGVPEVMTTHQTGILIDPRRASSLVDAFRFYDTHPDDARAYQTALTKTVHQFFTRDEMLRETLAVYTNTKHAIQ